MEDTYFRTTDLEEEEEEEEEDALSLCNLPIHGEESESDDYEKIPNLSFDQEIFEFLGTTDTKETDREMNSEKKIVFCGRLIPYEQEEGHSLISESFAATRSTSVRFTTPKPPSSRAVRSCRYSSISARSRKHNFTLVPEKFRPDMELSDIKKRQSRRPPAPMFPVDEGTGIGGKRRGHWGLIRLVRSRYHFGSVLAKASICCIPHA